MTAPAFPSTEPVRAASTGEVAPSGPIASRGPATLDSVDALRGYAILLVMLVHAQYLFLPAAEWLQRAASEGARGVQLFYIVSAYTLTRSLLHRLAETTDRASVYRAYAIRRAFRIVPLFYLIVLINFLDLGLSPRTWAPNGLSMLEIFSALVFVNAWIPNAITSVVDGGWSVAVEANFYVLLPFVLMVSTTRRRAVAIALIGGLIGYGLSEIIVSQLRQGENTITTLWFFKFWLPYQLLAFGIGIALYYRPTAGSGTMIAWLRRPAVFWPLMLVVLYIFFLRGKAFPIKVACLGVFTVLILENAGSLLVNRAVVFIGKISYSLYFLHFFVLRYLTEPIQSGLAFLPGQDTRFFAGFAVLVVVSSAFATLTWIAVEKPFIRWGGKLADRHSAPRMPAATA